LGVVTNSKRTRALWQVSLGNVAASKTELSICCFKVPDPPLPGSGGSLIVSQIVGVIFQDECFDGKKQNMKNYRKELWFKVPTCRAFINFTSDVQHSLDESGIKDGLVLCNAKHI